MVVALVGLSNASWQPEKVTKARGCHEGEGDFWIWENQFGRCVGGSHPLLQGGVTRSESLFTVLNVLHANKAVEETRMIPACQPTSLSCAGRSLMTAALSTRQRPSDSGVVMRHHKGASAEGGRGSADRSTEEEGLPASTEELASADTSRPLEAIVEEKESQLGLTEKGVIRSQGEGEDKPENMEETETNQAKVKKKIVSFCQKVNAGARAFKEKFKVIFKNNGGGGVL